VGSCGDRHRGLLIDECGEHCEIANRSVLLLKLSIDDVGHYLEMKLARQIFGIDNWYLPIKKNSSCMLLKRPRSTDRPKVSGFLLAA
jgi:hypothetical protein